MSDWSTDLARAASRIGDAEELIEEMFHANVIVAGDSAPEQPQACPTFFPSRRW